MQRGCAIFIQYSQNFHCIWCQFLYAFTLWTQKLLLIFEDVSFKTRFNQRKKSILLVNLKPAPKYITVYSETKIYPVFLVLKNKRSLSPRNFVIYQTFISWIKRVLKLASSFRESGQTVYCKIILTVVNKLGSIKLLWNNN